MKKLLSTIIFCLICTISYADQKAITEKGEEVILYDSGRWKYTDDSRNTNAKTKVKRNSKRFKKSAKATFHLKSKKNDTGVWLDPKKWSFDKSKSNAEAEYQFILKGKDLHGLMIAEAIEIEPETLAKIALDNAKRAAPDARIVSKEYRNVNGHDVIQLNILGTIQGIRFSYLGYYYSDKSGSTQLLTFTSENLFPKYRKEAETFLNGFTVR